jgi:hypothetical protein
MVWLMRAVCASGPGYPTARAHTPRSENYASPGAARTHPRSRGDVPEEREMATPDRLGWPEHLRDPVDHRLAPAVHAATIEHGAVMD